MKKLFLKTNLILALTCNLAYSNQKGNGGDGLLINGRPILLDLVEAGVDDKPVFNDAISINPMLIERVKKNIPQFPEIHARLAQKLSEIEKNISISTAIFLAEGLRFYNFRVVNEALVNIKDDDSVIDYDPQLLVQLAIRRNGSIFLNGKWWPKLEVDQKVALIFHEIIYAFQEPQMVMQNEIDIETRRPIKVKVSKQDSSQARALTAFLFTKDLETYKQDGFFRVSHQSYLKNINYFNVDMEFKFLESVFRAYPKTSLKVIIEQAI